MHHTLKLITTNLICIRLSGINCRFIYLRSAKINRWLPF